MSRTVQQTDPTVERGVPEAVPTVALPPLPAGLAHPQTGIVHGLFAGRTPQDPLAYGPRHGRARRFRYHAAGDAEVALGAAVVDLGAVAVAFAWAQLGARTLTWERRLPFGRGASIGRGLDEGASLRVPGARLALDPDGAMRVDVPVAGHGRLTAHVRTLEDVTPAVAITATAGGGWNATQKAAGTRASGWVRLADGERVLLGPEASGWRDATSGRQDRRTTWRWAAGGGVGGGRRVGINVSTGMNAHELGEDVVWWDGVPHRLGLERLGPQDEWEPTGDWTIAGPDWQLWFEPRGIRAKDERLVLLESRYVQPIGTFTGTLPDPAGRLVDVRMTGVTEDHVAVW
jgi:hypothetical protein